MTHEIFIVDDEIDIRTLMKDILLDEGYNVREFSDSKSFLDALENSAPKLVLLDIWLKGSEFDGIQLLEKVKSKYPETAIVMISGHGNIENAVVSIQKGAYDFIEKPFNSDRLLLVVARALQNVKLVEENISLKYKNQMSDQIIGECNKINALKNAIDKAAETTSRILVSGPVGSGKDVVARALHNKSDRRNNPFIIFNCAGLNSYGLEMEMMEAFKNADGGTLVLDEVCDLPSILQGKLLKLLQDEKFSNVRIISTTNQNLLARIEQGTFREDLFYRLNVFPISVPSLVERKDDINVLANYFMKKYCDSVSMNFKGFTEQAMTALKSYEWSGNVRQLRNSMEWIAITLGNKIETNEVTLDMLPVEIYSNKVNLVAEKSYKDYLSLPLKEARDAFEKEYLIAHLARHDSVSKLAEFIGMERTALHRKLKQLEIEYKK